MSQAAADFDLRDHLAGPFGMVGAAANVILQLGHPGVGYGVLESRVDSGNVLLHPWKRLRTTLSYLVVAMFGSVADKQAMREAVNTAHREVKSTAQSPVGYNAFDPELQLWVAVCLYVGFRDLRNTMLGQMDRATDERLLRELKVLGTTLQVPEHRWPESLDAFEDYWQAGLSKLHYDEPVREHLMKVVELRMVPRWLQLGNASVNRFFTIAYLPPEARAAMGLEWTPRQQRRFERLLPVMRAISRAHPRWLRYAPVWLMLHEIRMRRRLGWPLV